MALKIPTPPYGISKDLLDLIGKFNSVPEEDHVQRLFYLQKINYLLNTVKLGTVLFAWLGNTGADGWLTHLNAYEINADASIFVKGMQFAQAIAQHTKDKPVLDTPVDNVYPLLQERDKLLSNPSFEDCKERYVAVSCHLQTLVDSDYRISEIVKRHSEILSFAKAKLDAIQKRETPPTDVPVPSYKTKELGKQVNNYNFKLEMEGWKEPFVFRVEDRDKLGLEQDLHSFPVAKYFIEDYAVFMMEFTGEMMPVDYKPVVLSQFANGGNLADVAKSLKNVTRDKAIGPIASHYFAQLGDFCVRLMEAKTFHPDIKLTNFLVHNNLIRVSDRKTFIAEENPTAANIRSTPHYAPDEFTACLNEEWTNYDHEAASQTVMNMPQFMAYQLGMALKEFLILTQMDTTPDLEIFRTHDFNPAHYFKTTPNQIVNLSVLVQELTRPDPSKRLSIQQFKNLLMFRSRSPEQFYKEVERELPSATIGFQEDIDAIKILLDGDLPKDQFIARANLIFNELSNSPSKEPRLIRMAEKLATKCYWEYTESFFKQSIETALLEKDWEVAPWYRQLLHVVSFGYFRVDKVTELSEIQETMGLDLNGEPFLSYFPHLEFLPSSELDSLGKTEAQYLKNVIKQNVEVIISHEGSSACNSSSVATTGPLDVTLADSKETAPLNVTPISSTKTDPLNETPKGSKKADTSLSKSDPEQPLGSPDKEQSLESTTEYSSSCGTMVINSKKKTVPIDQRLSFFAPDENNPLKPKPALPSRVDSVRTSLFRGDGSHRKKPAQGQRTNINDFVWEPFPTNQVDLVDLPQP